MLVEQMCKLINGGCKYPGRDMTASHANMKVYREIETTKDDAVVPVFPKETE